MTEHTANVWQSDDGHYHKACPICGMHREWWYEGVHVRRRTHDSGDPHAIHRGAIQQTSVLGLDMEMQARASGELPEPFARWAEEHDVD